MSFELEVILRTTPLLVVVALVATLLRRRSASLRHALWTIALASALAIPLVLPILPASSIMSLPLLPASETIELRTSADDTVSPATPQPTLNSTTEQSAEAREGRTVSIGGGLWQTLERQAPSRWSVVFALRLMWCAGVVLMLVRWFIALAQLRKLRRRSLPLHDEEWSVLVQTLQGDLGVPGAVELRIAAADLPPMTWGVIRPLILLPASAVEWPLAQRRMVLAHELAHVKRGDGLGQLLCQAVCAFYWINPLVWYAARRMQAERERACDDYVLRLGYPPADYADHLVGIARGLNSGFVRTAVSMAHPSELRTRVAAILNSRARRQRISVPIAGTLVLAVAAVAVALSVVKITALAAMTLPGLSPFPVPSWVAEQPIAELAAEAAVPQAAPFASAAEMKAFIDARCATCHAGARRGWAGAAFTDTDVTAVRSNAAIWEQVVRRLRTELLSHSAFEPRPDATEMRRAALWLEKELDRDGASYVSPLGAHRLNRREYTNAIRDLLALEIDATAMLPAAEGYSDYFDNQILMLRTTPELERAYVAAAGAIAERAVGRSADSAARSSTPTPDSPSRRAVFICRPDVSTLQESFSMPSSQRLEMQRSRLAVQEECAQTILRKLAARAFRRDPREEEIGFLMDLYRQEVRLNGEFELGVLAALRNILTDRRFLYRTEIEPAGLQPKRSYRIDDFDLASRLSFFLWSSIPDERLLDLARRGQLQDPSLLERETRRMLQDPRAEALVVNFADQWLTVSWFKRRPVANQVVPELAPALWQSMRRELDLFIGSMVREDRSVADLLTADHTFVDDRLAKHYGLPTAGDEFQRVTLPAAFDVRRGLLGKSAIQVTATNPYTDIPIVQRGVFVYRLLGLEPIPPPPDVPQTTPRKLDDPNPLTTRQRLEKELSINRTCQTCHAAIDPLGNALGNFDLNGHWQTEEFGRPIDTSVVLVNGAKLNGVADLRQVLVSHSDEFVQTFTERLLVYALGRSLDYRDMPGIRSIGREAGRGDNRFSAIIVGIVKSPVFQRNVKP